MRTQENEQNTIGLQQDPSIIIGTKFNSDSKSVYDQVWKAQIVPYLNRGVLEGDDLQYRKKLGKDLVREKIIFKYGSQIINIISDKFTSESIVYANLNAIYFLTKGKENCLCLDGASTEYFSKTMSFNSVITNNNDYKNVDYRFVDTISYSLYIEPINNVDLFIGVNSEMTMLEICSMMCNIVVKNGHFVLKLDSEDESLLDIIWSLSFIYTELNIIKPITSDDYFCICKYRKFYINPYLNMIEKGYKFMFDTIHESCVKWIKLHTTPPKFKVADINIFKLKHLYNV
jgi:hypothetical protein